MSNHASLGDYWDTGSQDASNVFSWDDFPASRATPPLTPEQIVDAGMSDPSWDDKASWLAQQDSDDRAALGDDAIYNAWRDGWRTRAISIVRDARCDNCGRYAEGNTCCGGE